MAGSWRNRAFGEWSQGVGRLGGFIVALVAASWPPLAWATQSEPVVLAKRWTVIGIISSAGGGSPSSHNVAVLKDRNTERTFPVKVGDALPQGAGSRLVAIEDHRVTVAQGDQVFELEFAEAEGDDPGASATEAVSGPGNARFLEAYYRGYTDEPPAVFDTFEASDGEREASGGEAGAVNANRFAMTYDARKDDGRWPFELYRHIGDPPGSGAAQESEAGGKDDAGADGSTRLPSMAAVPPIPLLPPLVIGRPVMAEGGEDGSGELGH